MTGNDIWSRREMLGLLAGTGLGAALAPAVLRAEAAGRWRMKLSASSVAFTSLPIEAACERIAGLGFDAIDIWASFRGCTHLDDAAARLGADGLRDLLAKHRLKVNAFSVYTTGYPRFAELLGDVGGGVAVRGSQGGLPKPAELQSRMKRFFEKLKPDLELAEQHNGYLAIENHGNALLHTLDAFKAFVDLNPHKRLGIALAPYHLQSIKVPIEDAIRVAGSQLFFFYAWQKSRGLGQLPGHGPADAVPWLQALADIGYDRYVNPFLHHEPGPDETAAALAKSRDYLLECAKQSAGAEQGKVSEGAGE